MKKNRVLTALLAVLLLFRLVPASRALPPAMLQLDLQSHSVFMNGQGDGFFHPNDAITRAEAAQILYTLMTERLTAATYYPDVSSSDWFCVPVSALGGMGLLRSDENGNIRPNDPITRGEFAHMIGPFVHAAPQGAAFSDISDTYWAYDAVMAASASGIFCGYEDGTFRSEGELTRAQAATAICRLLGRTADIPALDAASERVSIFPDVPPDFWAYSAVMEATVPHYSSGGSFDQETWTQVGARPTAIPEGYHTINGQLYRVQNGIILRSVTVDGFTFDAAGRYTTGSESLDATLAKIVQEKTDSSMTRDQKLRALYNYVRDDYTYLKRPLVDKSAAGWEPGYAEEFFRTGRGNCFSYAAAFCLLARQLGLPAYTVVGKLGTRNVQDHGWVEISMDGKTYMFDPELEWSYQYKYETAVNLFKMDPNNAPYTYTR